MNEVLGALFQLKPLWKEVPVTDVMLRENVQEVEDFCLHANPGDLYMIVLESIALLYKPVYFYLEPYNNW